MKKHQAIWRICQRLLLSSLVIALLCVASAFYAEKKFQDVWSKLGISSTDGMNNIKFSLKNGHFYYTGAKKAALIPAGDRNAIIKELAVQARNYSKSEAFNKEYQKDRERKKPAPPLPVETREEIIAREKLRLERLIAQLEVNVNSENEKVSNGAKAGLPRYQKELSDINAPDNKVINQRVANAKRSEEAGNKRYQESLVKWETENPSNPDYLVKKRLEEVLALTEDVDYSAELKDVNGIKKFVNPVYEAKPKEWKLAYRAGKPATETVRAIAMQWLKELK